jgi:hypothetical protein
VAVVGSYEGEKMRRELQQAMSEGGYELVLPEIVAPEA